MATVYITKGYPASGKSTWAKEMVRKSGGLITRVNKDDLREMMHQSFWSKENEKLVLNIRDRVITAALRQGRDVIVDDTNLNPHHERSIRNLVGPDHKVEVVFFDVDVEECIRRDALRGSAMVGEEVIRRMASQWKNWKNVDCSVEFDLPEPVEPIPGLPWVIICDLDGTAAHGIGVHRRAYEWRKCIDDTVDHAVHETVCALFEAGWDIVYMSGRDSECREETEQWLKMHEFPEGSLFMRSEKDNRRDSIVKRELFDNNIRGKYNVLFVLDDREQVVQMWRELGLKVFQVAPGAFEDVLDI